MAEYILRPPKPESTALTEGGYVLIPPSSESDNRGLADKIKGAGSGMLRDLGLNARSELEGLSSIPDTMIGAPMVGLLNLLNEGVERIYGRKMPRYDMPSFGRTLSDAVGLPKPETPTERITSDVFSAMGGAGGMIKAGKSLAKNAEPLARAIGEVLQASPGMQTLSAAGGGAAGGLAREQGASPAAQTGAAIAGGIVAPTALASTLTAGNAAARGVRAAVDPFTQVGKERVVGAALNRFATDPTQAISNIDSAERFVPGSLPTTAQAARDEGLLIAERGLSASSPLAGAQFSRNVSNQNKARNILLRSMSGTPEDITAAEASREAQGTQLRQAAFANKSPVDMIPVTTRIDEIAKSPAGKRQTVADAMSWVRGRLDGVSDPEELYAIRQDIGDVLGGKLQGEKANLRLASSQLQEVRRVLDDAIDKSAPGFKNYLSQYREMSKPINQMEELQSIGNRVVNAGTDANTGDRIMSAAKFYNAVTKNREELSKILTPQQLKNLEVIGSDLDRASLSSSSGKSAGSNTTQNLSTAYVIGSALGNGAAENGIIKNLARPLGWLNKLNEGEIQDLLINAMLDPGITRSLMSKATPRSMESIGFELLQKAKGAALGGSGAAIGGLQRQ